MYTWIGNNGGSAVPDSVDRVMNAIGDVGALAGLRSPEGGIERDVVVDALSDRCRRAGLTAVRGSFLDGHDAVHRIGLRVEAGRAHTNNDGALAVLEAARRPEVDVLVLIVPALYKGSTTAERVRDRVRWLLDGGGIRLDLTGVALSTY